MEHSLLLCKARPKRSSIPGCIDFAVQGKAEEVELEEGGDLFDEEAPARKQKKKKAGKKRRTVEEEQEEEEELEPEEVAGLQVGFSGLLWCGCSPDSCDA